MKISELKAAIFTIVSKYFAGATVVWENTEKTKPPDSLVTLRLGAVGNTQHYIEQTSDDGDVYDVIPSSVPLTVQLFTHGKKIVTDGGVYYENTAMDDMMDFVKYMTSRYVIQLSDSYDISITTEGPVKDATGVLDPNYEYRAFQEFTVAFKQEAYGYAGISDDDWEQTSSGGGTAELAEQEINDVDSDSIEITKNFN